MNDVEKLAEVITNALPQMSEKNQWIAAQAVIKAGYRKVEEAPQIPELREEIRFAICSEINGDPDCKTDDCTKCGFKLPRLSKAVASATTIIQPLIDQAVQKERELLHNHYGKFIEQITIQDEKEKSDAVQAERAKYEEVKLEGLGEVDLLQPWLGRGNPESFKQISQATIAHNESKGKLYRKVD